MGETQLSQEQSAQLLAALNGLTPVGELSDVPTVAPAIQFTARLRSGTQETVALLPLGNEYYAVSINGTAAFATDAKAWKALQVVWESLTAAQ